MITFSSVIFSTLAVLYTGSRVIREWPVDIPVGLLRYIPEVTRGPHNREILRETQGQVRLGVDIVSYAGNGSSEIWK